LGVQSAQAVSDFCSALFALPFTFAFFKSLKKLQLENEKQEK
jgi:hypothetical protein